MYHPYFRGRQNELIAIRENAALMADAEFVPIIEPVKAATNGLVRALAEIGKANGAAILVANPVVGDFKDNGKELHSVISKELANNPKLSVGIRIGAETEINKVARLFEQYPDGRFAILHCGHASGKEVLNVLPRSTRIWRHVFLDETCGTLYRRHFKGDNKVLLRDGFKRRVNRDYPEVEPFSELHVTYEDEGVHGFGDFLIVGDDYQEAGGPAYAIAIHLTYIDPTQEDTMFVCHFVSDTTDTPADPAGKFQEALEKLVDVVKTKKRPIQRTAAVSEFIALHKKEHFPGLGVVKKLSMQHHIETLERFVKSQANKER